MSEGGSKSKKSFRELPAFCRQGKQAALCFLALLFVAPYLQHNLYHTTLFARYGDSDFAVFSLFSVILAAWLILCIIAQKKVAFWLDSRRGAAIAAGAATVGTATIYFAPSFVEGVPMLAWGLFGASCYAAGFAYLAIRSFLVLGSMVAEQALRPPLSWRSYPRWRAMWHSPFPFPPHGMSSSPCAVLD